MKKQLLTTFFFAGLTFIAKAQIPDLGWARQLGGRHSAIAYGVTSDPSGNVYTTGYIMDTADLDPGPGIFNVVSAGNRDILISKLDAGGNFLWGRNLGGPGFDIGYSIASDPQGNVLTTGTYTGTVDFNPDTGVFNLPGSSDESIFVSKLDANGNFVWAKRLGGGNNDRGHSVTTDAMGNVYITGAFAGSGDFNPGTGVFGLTSAGSADIYICKLNAEGNFIWAKKIGGSSTEIALYVHHDAFGGIYMTGEFNASVDFNPGAGNFKLTSSGEGDVFICKLDTAGNFIWARQLGGKGDDVGYSVSTDAKGNIYTSGLFSDTADLDPGPGTFNLYCVGKSEDIFISKLDSGGKFIWAKHFEGDTFYILNKVKADAGGNVYVTGSFRGTADLDPGTGKASYSSPGYWEAFACKLDTSGSFQWAASYGSKGNDFGRSLALDNNGNILISGEFTNTVDFDASASTYSLTDKGGSDAFILKLKTGAGASLSQVIMYHPLICPNPTSGRFIIDMVEVYAEIQVIVRNVMGQEVLSQKFFSTDKASLDIAGATGIYFIEVNMGAGNKAFYKLLKE